ncbi:MAG TPA: ribosome biogenesis GTP-binding protein YihA/YsxC [Candidatus Paceibacterota bacterium]|nr:ribosome biogenesis GTP-binding protein YihA/YsxC [Candidatus Paceibacterota bacterium]
MKVTSAEFVKPIRNGDDLLTDNLPQIVFIGRSNVGKSSVINSFARKQGLARSSSTPGRTQEINVFLINKAFYLIDLPGYGYARGSFANRERLSEYISWYLFSPEIKHHKVVLIIDTKVGLTADDKHILKELEESGKDIVILANKADRLKSGELKTALMKLRQEIGEKHLLIPYSAKDFTGIGALVEAILPR